MLHPDDRPSRPMQPRAVRIPIYDATVAFNRRQVTLVNISRTGALLRVHAPAPLGSEGRLVIGYKHTTIQIDARVVRCHLASTAGTAADGDWNAGIKFVAPPPDEVTQLLRRIISLG